MVAPSECDINRSGPVVTFRPRSAKRLRSHGLRPESRRGQPYLMMARYYSSSVGRFMSPDPVGDTALRDPQSWNLFAYVRNNPLAYIDPSGTSSAWSLESSIGSQGLGRGVGDNPIGATPGMDGAKDARAMAMNTACPGSANSTPTPWEDFDGLQWDRSQSDGERGSESSTGVRVSSFAQLFPREAEWHLHVAPPVPLPDGYEMGEVGGRGVFSRLFEGGSWLNKGQYLRIGVSRMGGDWVFRASGKWVETLGRIPFLQRFIQDGHIVFKNLGPISGGSPPAP